jgi:triacylglycerol esterase/lipase EstA (alpha/beta hydrolase family)
VKKSKSVSKLNADWSVARRVAQAEKQPLEAWVARQARNSLQGVVQQLFKLVDELSQTGINKKPKLISKSFGFVTWEH